MWEKLKKYLPFLTGLLMLSAGSFLLLKVFLDRPLGCSAEPPPDPIPKDQEPTKAEISNLVFDVVTRAGYSENFGNIAVAVARHETGNYQSKIFKLNNNLFGMRFPVKRDTTAKDEKFNYARYATIENSIEDYTLYLEYFNYPKTFDSVADYVDYAKEKGYFSDTKAKYLSALQRWILKD